MKLSKCCCCVPVALGVKILGALDILSFVSAALVRFDIITMILLLAPVITFILMLIEDCKRNRMLFFAAFTFYRIVLLCLYFVKVYWDFFDEPPLDE